LPDWDEERAHRVGHFEYRRQLVFVKLASNEAETLLHDGQAWVQQREGGGASFRVFLPI